MRRDARSTRFYTHTHTQNHAHLMHKHQSAWLLHHNIAKTPYACRMKFLGKYKRNTDSIQFRLNIVRGRHRTAHCTIDAVTNSIHNAMAEIYEFLGWNNHVIVLFVGIVHITCELCVSLFFSLSLSMCVCVCTHTGCNISQAIFGLDSVQFSIRFRYTGLCAFDSCGFRIWKVKH